MNDELLLLLLLELVEEELEEFIWVMELEEVLEEEMLLFE